MLKRIRFLAVSAIFASLAMVLYPAAGTAALTLRQIQAADSYERTVWEGEEKERQEEWDRALEYNAELYKKQLTEPFRYMGGEAGDPVYEKMLGDRILCVLEIPAIDLTVPVVHGTGSEEMKTAAGHFYGTSLPCGGVSSHAGIAAHSGLPDARLFSDLEELKNGERFYIHVMGETHVYRIENMRTVEPQEADRFMQIEKDRDLITLYTCTPRGLNTHRLLVRGVRDPEEESRLKTDGEAAAEKVRREKTSLLSRAALKSRITLAGIALCLPLGSFGAAVYLDKKRSCRDR